MNAIRLPISVLVQTKNEEAGIGACLSALSDFGEVVVVDSDSTDETKAIARRAGAKVVNFTWDGRYPKKKQWQLENVDTAYPWILFLDADETPESALITELKRVFALGIPPGVSAFDIELNYTFAGRVLRHGHRVVKRCLVRRGAVEFPALDDLDAPGMGELEGHYQPAAQGAVSRLKGRILHNDLDPVSTWFTRHNKYSDWEAHLRSKKGLRSNVRSRRSRQGRIFDATPFKPLVFFAYAYFARAGFLDGRAGLDYALALAMYYWQIDLKVRELARQSDSAAR